MSQNKTHFYTKTHKNITDSSPALSNNAEAIIVVLFHLLLHSVIWIHSSRNTATLHLSNFSLIISHLFCVYKDALHFFHFEHLPVALIHTHQKKKPTHKHVHSWKYLDAFTLNTSSSQLIKANKYRLISLRTWCLIGGGNLTDEIYRCSIKAFLDARMQKGQAAIMP